MLRITWTSASGALQVIEADVSPGESHETGADVTEHAVERGAAIADHVRGKPGTVSIQGMISDAPVIPPTTQMDGTTGEVRSLDLGNNHSATVLQFSGPFERVRIVDDLIQGIVRNGILVDLETHLRTYEQIALTSFRVVLDATTGDALPFTLEGKQVRIVDTETVEVPDPVERRGRPTQNRGAQPATTPDPPLRSVLSRGLAALTGGS